MNMDVAVITLGQRSDGSPAIRESDWRMLSTNGSGLVP